MFATMLVACALSVMGLIGVWWGKTFETKLVVIQQHFDMDISLWKLKSKIELGIDGRGSGSSSSETSVDELCEHVADNSPDDQKEFCKMVVVIRVCSFLGLFAAAVGLVSASLFATSLLCEFPWKTPPSSSLLLVNATMAGFITVFTVISIAIAASVKEDGFSSSIMEGTIEVRSSDFGVRGSGFICNVLLLIVAWLVGAGCLVAWSQEQKESPTRNVCEAPTILGSMSNAVKKAAGAQNV